MGRRQIINGWPNLVTNLYWLQPPRHTEIKQCASTEKTVDY